MKGLFAVIFTIFYIGGIFVVFIGSIFLVIYSFKAKSSGRADDTTHFPSSESFSTYPTYSRK